MNKKTTLVLGASDNPSRYSFLAINKLRRFNHSVAALGRKQTIVADVPVGKELKPLDDIDTVTLYLNPTHQKEYYDYIVSLNPRRIIFNPGTENPELEELARKNNIQPIHGCTLVMLSTGQY